VGNLHRRKKKECRRARRQADDAWKAAERSDIDKAEEMLRHAVEARPGDCVLWNDLGLILWRQDKPRDAEKAFRNALLLRPDYEDGKMNLASFLASRGFYRQALKLEEELAETSLRAEFHRKKVAEYRAEAERVTLEGDRDATETVDETGDV
jgi:predicted Zn-dependent protease